MPTTYDVIVLGGGTMGSAAAWELGKRGARALVLEQFAHIHPFGAHGGQTRVIRHAYAEGEEYVPLVRRADDLWQALEEESGRRILVRCGGLELAAPGFTHASAARRSAEAQGLPHETISAEEANRRWPAVRVPADWDVLYSPQAGFLLTEPALRAMGEGARRRGVVIREHEPVTGWEVDGEGITVRTEQGTYRADRLIVTAGAWSGRLLEHLGLPLTVLRKVLWWLAVEDPAPFAPERFPVFIADSPLGEIYGFPIFERPGLKIADHAGGDPTLPDAVDRTVREGESANVAALAQQLFPLATAHVLESVVCLYTNTPDHDFVVDRYPGEERVVLGAGFSGHGFKFATAVGELLVQLALDPGAETLPRLSPRRFSAHVGVAGATGGAAPR